MTVLDRVREKPYFTGKLVATWPRFRWGQMASPGPLAALAAFDISATLVTGLGGSIWLPGLLAISCVFGYLLGHNDKQRLQSLGIAMSSVSFTALGLCWSFSLGNGVMDERIAGAMRSFIALHCGAMICGHAIAFFVRRSRVRVARRAL
jgi:hypothetical protein